MKRGYCKRCKKYKIIEAFGMCSQCILTEKLMKKANANKYRSAKTH
ncbi:MAG: hypothetical protein KAS32_06165 [Candidatus Peribacteraceae bacterium]|nr:hypothetical protein [Candidatus Peribacteraceae bacterium]